MPTLSITRLGENNLAHDWSHVLKVITDMETFLNTTKIDYLNVQTNGIYTSQIRSEAAALSVGQRIRNATGSALTAPVIVAIGGQYDAGGGIKYPSVVKADAGESGSHKYAQGIITTTVADGNDGTMYTLAEIASLNTSARAVHDPIWLDTTAGGYVYAPPTPTNICQLIGFVSVSHETAGVIALFFPGILVPYGFVDQVGPIE